jgi:hypothetical protein
VSTEPARGRDARRRAARDDDDRPVLPTVSSDELDEGWGDERGRGSERDEDWYRRERPPHHG